MVKRKPSALQKKRLVTYNPKLASKKKYEIAKQIEKQEISVTVRQNDQNMEI